jgi:hypothetical protein
MTDVMLCTCHGHCRAHCAVPRTQDNTRKAASTWFSLLDKYSNLAPTTAWNAQVLKLLTHSVNGVDPKNRLSPVHGFILTCTDDHAYLLHTLLELGSDAEVWYVKTWSIGVVYMIS